MKTFLKKVFGKKQSSKPKDDVNLQPPLTLSCFVQQIIKDLDLSNEAKWIYSKDVNNNSIAYYKFFPREKYVEKYTLTCGGYGYLTFNSMWPSPFTKHEEDAVRSSLFKLSNFWQNRQNEVEKKENQETLKKCFPECFK